VPQAALDKARALLLEEQRSIALVKAALADDGHTELVINAILNRLDSESLQ